MTNGKGSPADETASKVDALETAGREFGKHSGPASSRDERATFSHDLQAAALRYARAYYAEARTYGLIPECKGPAAPDEKARETARVAVRSAMYDALSDDVLPFALRTPVVDALIDAAWSPWNGTAAANCDDPACSDADLHSHVRPAARRQIECSSLWEFLQAVGPALGIPAPPLYLRAICDKADRVARAEAARCIAGRLEPWLKDGGSIAASFPDLADIVTAARAQAVPTVVVDAPTGPTTAERKSTERAVVALDRSGRDVAFATWPGLVDAVIAHRRAALAYAAAELEAAGEAGTTAAARLLLGQISEELA